MYILLTYSFFKKIFIICANMNLNLEKRYGKKSVHKKGGNICTTIANIDQIFIWQLKPMTLTALNNC